MTLDIIEIFFVARSRLICTIAMDLLRTGSYNIITTLFLSFD